MSTSNLAPSYRTLVAVNTADYLVRSSYQRSRRGLLASIARALHRSMDAESCAIFIVSGSSPARLELAGSYSDVMEDRFDPVSLEIGSRKGGGLTGHLAALGKTATLTAPEIESSPFRRAERSRLSYLEQGISRSLLTVPLHDRKGRLLGLIKIENRKGDRGRIADHFLSNAADRATKLCDGIASSLEHLRSTEVLSTLVAQLTLGRGLSGILETVLIDGMKLVTADRGDLALYDQRSDDLILRNRSGDGLLAVGEAVPRRSLMWKVWQSGGYEIFADVSSEDRYLSADGRTKSELVVCLEWSGQKVGVLNVESFQPGAFDEHDVETLKVFAEYAAIVTWAAERDEHFIEIIETLGHAQPPPKFLETLLQQVRGLYPVDGGIFYIANDERKVLQCTAVLGNAPPIEDPAEFGYRYDEPSLATQVFHTGETYFSLDPARDQVVNHRGLRAFGITSPVLGVRLTFEGRVVGVLVVWGKRVTPELAVQLKPFVLGATAAIVAWESQSREHGILSAIRDIFSWLQTEPLSQDFLPILHGVRAIGFDRARVFEFLGDRFVGRAQAGSHIAEFREFTVLLSESSYARDMVERAQRDRDAWIYEPGSLGEDPYVDLLGRKENLPWAVVPLVIGGRINGFMAADNTASSRPITPWMMRYLTLFGALGAQAIALTQAFETWRRLTDPEVVARLGQSESSQAVIRRFLVFLSSGGGLGFNRAIFLARNPSTKRFVYGAGLGSTTHAQFSVKSRTAAAEGIASLFDRATELFDEDLDAAMRDFGMDESDPTLGRLLAGGPPIDFRREEAVTWPNWMHDLETRIDAEHVLVASVRDEETTVGLFIVDRRWQHRIISEGDRTALAAAAHLAGLLIHQNRLTRLRAKQSVPVHEKQLRTPQVALRAWFAEGQAPLRVGEERHLLLCIDADLEHESLTQTRVERVADQRKLDKLPFELLVSSDVCDVEMVHTSHLPGDAAARVVIKPRRRPASGRAQIRIVVTRNETVLFLTDRYAEVIDRRPRTDVKPEPGAGDAAEEILQ